MEDNENINKHLKNSLDEYLVQPKITSFDEVIKKLERKRKRRFILLFFSGALLFTIGTTLFYKVDGTSDVTQQNTIAIENEPKNTQPVELKSNLKPEKALAAEDFKSLPKTTSVNKSSTSATKFPDTKTNQKKKINSLSIKKKPASTASSLVSEAAVRSIAKHNSIPKKNGSSLVDTDEKNIADQLNSKKLFLPVSKTNLDLIPSSVEDVELALTKEDSTKKVKKIQFLLGLSYNPQFVSYQFSKSNGSIFDNEFSAAYLKNKKDQNTIKFNFSFGLKTGVLIKDKWELLAGVSFQRYRQEETIKKLTDGNTAPTVMSTNNNGLSNAQNFESFDLETAAIGKTYTSTYRYLDYSMELNRIIKLRNSLKLKAGIGFHYQQLFLRKSSSMIIAESPDVYYYSSGNNSIINRSKYSFDIKGGLIENLTERMQIQFCPNFFYSPKSMFKKEYIIKQKNYGLGVEVLLLFKIG